MPRERDTPYVASGFRVDAEKVLEKFIAKKTLRFSEFAKLWREYKFSLIFMGRETLRELTEFIQECYRNTMLYLDTSDAYQKVGAVYLLYSLYLKQPLFVMKNPVPIVIAIRQVYEMYQLENHFLESGTDEYVMDLVYIINKMSKIDAFHISCNPIPMGPMVPLSVHKLCPLRSSHFKEILGCFSMLLEKDIKNIHMGTLMYEEVKKKNPIMYSSSKSAASLNRYQDLKQTISELEERYNAGLRPTKTGNDEKNEDIYRYLGKRRAFLKSQQYERATDVGLSRRVRASSDSSPTKTSTSPPPPPVFKRKRGRPKGSKGRKKKGQKTKVKVEVKTEKVENTEDDYDREAEMVDNPDFDTGFNFAPHRPLKAPRPVRRHYFED